MWKDKLIKRSEIVFNDIISSGKFLFISIRTVPGVIINVFYPLYYIRRCFNNICARSVTPCKNSADYTNYTFILFLQFYIIRSILPLHFIFCIFNYDSCFNVFYFYVYFLYSTFRITCLKDFEKI